MYNWRLLLFAFFAVYQPFASFAERNLVDGRQQCCDHRFSRDTGSLNDNYPKLPTEDRRLSYRRDVREERRNELLNERSVIIRSAAEAVYDSREREVRASPQIRSFRTELRRMSTRIVSPETKASDIRDIATNLRERNLARENVSRASRISTSDRQSRDVTDSEKTIYRRRETDLRDARRLIPNNEVEFRRIRDTREVRHEILRVNNSPMQRSLFQNGRASHLEMASDRDLKRRVTRDDGRYQHTNQRSAQSLDRIFRATKERRSSLDSFRTMDKERSIRSEFQGVRNNELKNNHNEARGRERVDTSRLTYGFMARQQDGNNRERFFRNTNQVRDNRVGHYDRRFERSTSVGQRTSPSKPEDKRSERHSIYSRHKHIRANEAYDERRLLRENTRANDEKRQLRDNFRANDERLQSRDNAKANEERRQLLDNVRTNNERRSLRDNARANNERHQSLENARASDVRRQSRDNVRANNERQLSLEHTRASDDRRQVRDNERDNYEKRQLRETTRSTDGRRQLRDNSRAFDDSRRLRGTTTTNDERRVLRENTRANTEKLQTRESTSTIDEKRQLRDNVRAKDERLQSRENARANDERRKLRENVRTHDERRQLRDNIRANDGRLQVRDNFKAFDESRRLRENTGANDERRQQRDSVRANDERRQLRNNVRAYDESRALRENTRANIERLQARGSTSTTDERRQLRDNVRAKDERLQSRENARANDERRQLRDNARVNDERRQLRVIVRITDEKRQLRDNVRGNDERRQLRDNVRGNNERQQSLKNARAGDERRQIRDIVIANDERRQLRDNVRANKERLQLRENVRAKEERLQLRENARDNDERQQLRDNARTESRQQRYQSRTIRSVIGRARSSEERLFRDERRVVELTTYYSDAGRNVRRERSFTARVTSETSRVLSQGLTARVAYDRRSVQRDAFNTRVDSQLDSRMKSVTELTRPQLNISQNESQNPGYNWQYLIYTMQGIYLFTILFPILMTKNVTKKKTMTLNWGSAFQTHIKVD